MSDYTKVLAEPAIDYAKTVQELMEREEAEALEEWMAAKYAKAHSGAVAVIAAGMGAA